MLQLLTPEPDQMVKVCIKLFDISTEQVSTYFFFVWKVHQKPSRLMIPDTH